MIRNPLSMVYWCLHLQLIASRIESQKIWIFSEYLKFSSSTKITLIFVSWRVLYHIFTWYMSKHPCSQNLPAQEYHGPVPNILLEKIVPTMPVDTRLPHCTRMTRVWQSLDLGEHLTENSQVSKISCPVSCYNCSNLVSKSSPAYLLLSIWQFQLS